MQRINYQLFRQRKNFDPTLLFKSNIDLSYEDFCDFFVKRNVEPPSKEYYMNVKTHYESLTEVPKIDLKEQQPVLEESIDEVFTLEPEDVKETVELIEETLKVVEEKPKRQRRRKKKVESDE